MDNLQLTKAPVAKTGMLIRKPVGQVFEAFVNPEITTKFWFTKSSGPLRPGANVQWDWEMYGVSIPVTVKAIEPNRRILIEWPGEPGPTTVEWVFNSHEDGQRLFASRIPDLQATAMVSCGRRSTRRRDSHWRWPASRRFWSTTSD